jgi:hypothetical protein
MKTPPPDEASRFLKLRVQGKQGTRLHPDDQDFLMRMWEEYREWYGSMEDEVFKRSAPAGSVQWERLQREDED